MKPILRTSTPTNKKDYKKCIKCRIWKRRVSLLDTSTGEVLEKHGFGAHDSSDGLQSICFTCKNIMNTKAREKNVTARIRHHTSTRCLTQLGDHAPPTFTADMESYLGYKVTALVKALGKDLKEREGSHRKLRDALNEGYHIDHKRPLSSFNVLMDAEMARNLGAEEGDIDWIAFKDCWAISNLTAIPAGENLAKGAKRLDLEDESESVPHPDTSTGNDSD